MRTVQIHIPALSIHISSQNLERHPIYDITYTVELATDYQFQNVIFRQEGVAVPEVQTSVPAAGQYFVRVRATDSSGKTQDAFDYYATDNGKNYGMKCFYVTADQRIEEDIYEKN